MHQSEHVQAIRAQTLGSTHLKSTHVVRKRKSSGQWSLSSCNGFRIVPNERVGVKGPWCRAWLWLEPTDWLLRWIIPTTSASICLEWRDSGAWISLVSLDLGTRRCPLRAPADGRVVSTPYSLKLWVAEPSPPENYPGVLCSPGWRDGASPAFFHLLLVPFPPVNLRETVLPWFVWLALTVLKTAIRRPFWKFVTD